MNTDKEQAEERLINEAFQGLLSTYLASKHRKKVDIITRAFNFAKHAHKGVRRNSGEPYILHPIAVARIVSEEIGLGSTSICAALLHDVVEDTEYTIEDIANLFGPKIAQIVDGLTKISGGIFGDKASAQTDAARSLVSIPSGKVVWSENRCLDTTRESTESPKNSWRSLCSYRILLLFSLEKEEWVKAIHKYRRSLKR